MHNVTVTGEVVTYISATNLIDLINQTCLTGGCHTLQNSKIMQLYV